jgi:hypothetical protein
MQKILQIVKRKPLLFVVASVVYVLLVGFAKWQVAPPLESLWFLVGALIGVYFLDAAEVFFALNPSPFRSMVFAAGFVVVSFFVVTSSGSLLASGLVLSLYLSLVLWQLGEWQVTHSLTQWYRMIAGPVSVRTQQWILLAFVALFLVETWLFIRW